MSAFNANFPRPDINEGPEHEGYSAIVKAETDKAEQERAAQKPTQTQAQQQAQPQPQKQQQEQSQKSVQLPLKQASKMEVDYLELWKELRGDIPMSPYGPFVQMTHPMSKEQLDKVLFSEPGTTLPEKNLFAPWGRAVPVVITALRLEELGGRFALRLAFNAEFNCNPLSSLHRTVFAEAWNELLGWVYDMKYTGVPVTMVDWINQSRKAVRLKQAQVTRREECFNRAELHAQLQHSVEQAQQRMIPLLAAFFKNLREGQESPLTVAAAAAKLNQWLHGYHQAGHCRDLVCFSYYVGIAWTYWHTALAVSAQEKAEILTLYPLGVLPAVLDDLVLFLLEMHCGPFGGTQAFEQQLPVLLKSPAMGLIGLNDSVPRQAVIQSLVKQVSSCGIGNWVRYLAEQPATNQS